MEQKSILTSYYENFNEDGRLQSRHGSVEFLTTMRYIEKYLKPGMRIIEIGAGTGRYSHALAQRGYRVDAVELVEHNIEVFKQNTKENEQVTICQGNAIDLSAFKNETYDITLLLGPMYHLYTKEDQEQALSEAIRVTKKGGIVFAAYCNNDATIIKFCFQKGMIRDDQFHALVDPVTFKGTKRRTLLWSTIILLQENQCIKGKLLTLAMVNIIDCTRSGWNAKREPRTGEMFSMC